MNKQTFKSYGNGRVVYKSESPDKYKQKLITPGTAVIIIVCIVGIVAVAIKVF